MAGFNHEQLLEAKETIMEAVCDLCHWPYHYRAYCLTEDVMFAEKCDTCPAAQAVDEILSKCEYQGKHEATGGAG